jgi:hypothetical protein
MEPLMTNRTQLLAEAVVSAYLNEIAQPLRLDRRPQAAEDGDQLLGLPFGDVLGEVPPDALAVEGTHGREAFAAGVG